MVDKSEDDVVVVTLRWNRTKSILDIFDAPKNYVEWLGVLEAAKFDAMRSKLQHDERIMELALDQIKGIETTEPS